ncbi:sensor histidine kinase [Caenispirillum bisanense]|uniref:sensor histidine kinase n=1 Tax=Caenispirillum bisanense TaxID=414052 RepID=UPI0031E3261A
MVHHGRRFRFGLERRWLLALVVALLAPLAAFEMLHVDEQRSHMLASERDSLDRTASAISRQIAVELHRAGELLASLSAVPQLAVPGHPDCPAVLAGIAAGQRRYTNFSVVDAGGYIVCSSSGPLAAPVFVGNQRNIGEAFETGGLGMSGFKLGPLTGRPVIVLSQPLRDGDGRIIGTVNGGLSLDWLQDMLLTARLPRRESIVVFNHDGLVLAASDPAATPGSVLPAVALEAGRAAVRRDQPAETDASRLVVHVRVPGVPGGAIVSASLPADEVLGAINRHAQVWALGFAGLAVLLFVLVSLAVDRLLLRRLDHLSQTARRFAEGDYSGEADRWADGSGLSSLARDLDAMAHELEGREQHLRQTLEDMAKARAETARFAYIAAHDLQEPLRAIGGFTQLLGRRLGADLDDQSRHYMQRITSAAERMRSMFKELMVYAVLDASDRMLTPVDLGALVADAARRHPGSHVHAQSLPVVAGNPRQLAALVDHLIDNAVTYADPARPSRVAVAAHRRRDVWEVSVRDNGIGIPESMRESVFHLFKKLDPDSGRGGTGIGLSMARRIAELHGGRMWISASTGVGCDVRFTLSAVEPSEPIPPDTVQSADAATPAAGVAA